MSRFKSNLFILYNVLIILTYVTLITAKINKQRWVSTPHYYTPTSILDVDNSPWFSDFDNNNFNCVGNLINRNDFIAETPSPVNVTSYNINIKGSISDSMCFNYGLDQISTISIYNTCVISCESSCPPSSCGTYCKDVNLINYKEPSTLSSCNSDQICINARNNIINCLLNSLPTNVNDKIIIKISTSAKIYDFDFQYQCGDISLLDAHPDKNKGINNGFSCHCPGGISDPQFYPCEFQSKVFHNNDNSTKFEICHNLSITGPADGCDFFSNHDTTFFSKFYSTWNVHPVFKFKRSTITEFVLSIFQLSSESTYNLGNVSLSNLGTVLIDKQLENSNIQFKAEFSLSNIESPKSDIQEFIIISSKTDFNDPNNIYVIHESRFNDKYDYDPNKLCPIKVNQDSLSYEAWRIDSNLKESIMPIKCHPSEGKLQIGMPQISKLFNAANKFSERFSTGDYDLYPGETNLLKERTEVNSIINLKTFSNINLLPITSTCRLLYFKFICNPSLNQDGFHCDFTTSTNTPGAMSILSKDSSSIIAQVNIKGFLQKFSLIINPIYASSNHITLCGSCQDFSSSICASHTVIYDKINNNDINNITNPDSINGNIDNGNSLFDSAGKMKHWVIGLITGLSVVGFLILAYFTYPIFIIIYKFLSVKRRKLMSYLRDKKKSIEAEHLEVKPETINQDILDQINSLNFKY